jgi:hypothetical protein
MNEPKKYILEEWDSMCAIANKARQSDCPLIEDEVLVEMHKYVGALDKRIAELGQKLSHAETMGDREQAIRDLEQQAKGVEALAYSMLFRGHLENTLDRYEVLDRAKALREQAKQLKEHKDDE